MKDKNPEKDDWQQGDNHFLAVYTHCKIRFNIYKFILLANDIPLTAKPSGDI